MADETSGPEAPLADAVAATGVITATELRRLLVAQCDVTDGSVAGYVTVSGVVDLIELADALNYLINTAQPVR